MSEHINEFATLIAQEFNIDSTKIMELWNEHFQNKLTESQLTKKTNGDLKQMCRERGLKVVGNKKMLIERLLGKEQPTHTKKDKKPKPSVLLKQINDAGKIHISRDDDGDYIDTQTGLVFDEITKKVIASKKDRVKKPLSEQDIEICTERGLEYELPETFKLE